MKEIKKKLFNEVSGLLPLTNWKELYISCHFSKSKYGLRIKYLDKNNKLNDCSFSSKYFKEFKKAIYNVYLEKIENPKERFNRLDFIVFPNHNFKENYYWDEEKEKEEKKVKANMFCYWLDSNLLNRISEYQKENNLLTPFYDEDGDFLHYEQSWDTGVFIFKIKNNKVNSLIELTFQGETKVLPMPLPTYIESEILKHYKITHSELKDDWQPWNVLKLKSRHRGIPMGEEDKYVFYRLEDEI